MKPHRCTWPPWPARRHKALVLLGADVRHRQGQPHAGRRAVTACRTAGKTDEPERQWGAVIAFLERRRRWPPTSAATLRGARPGCGADARRGRGARRRHQARAAARVLPREDDVNARDHDGAAALPGRRGGPRRRRRLARRQARRRCAADQLRRHRAPLGGAQAHLAAARLLVARGAGCAPPTASDAPRWGRGRQPGRGRLPRVGGRRGPGPAVLRDQGADGGNVEGRCNSTVDLGLSTAGTRSRGQLSLPRW